MVRVFLHYVLPLLTPLALYIVWVLIARRRAGARGADLSQDWRKGAVALARPGRGCFGRSSDFHGRTD